MRAVLIDEAAQSYEASRPSCLTCEQDRRAKKETLQLEHDLAIVLGFSPKLESAFLNRVLKDFEIMVQAKRACLQR